MLEKDRDFRRIGSISHGVYGFDLDNHVNQSRSSEINPNKLNLDKIDDFLTFLAALNRGEQKSLEFLKKIPEKRIEELKEKYKSLNALLLVLG